MELYENTVNGWQLLTFSSKWSVLDDRQAFEYTSAFVLCISLKESQLHRYQLAVLFLEMSRSSKVKHFIHVVSIKKKHFALCLKVAKLLNPFSLNF